MNQKKGRCDQCDNDDAIIAKTLPSSGKWCTWCNQDRLNEKKEGDKNKPCPTKPVIEKSILQKLVKDLDAVFSIFIRTRDADENGIVKCCTCFSSEHWKEMDNGHCFSRGNFEIRWNENNCHAQCKVCNAHVDGYFEVHSVYIKRRHGDAAFAELAQLKNVVKKLDRNELLEKIDMYKNLNNQNLQH